MNKTKITKISALHFWLRHLILDITSLIVYFGIFIHISFLFKEKKIKCLPLCLPPVCCFLYSCLVKTILPFASLVLSTKILAFRVVLHVMLITLVSFMRTFVTTTSSLLLTLKIFATSLIVYPRTTRVTIEDCGLILTSTLRS